MMDRFVVGFIRASLVWLGVGVLLGLLMTVWAPAIAYRPAHMHANLLGFVSMMIFGVAYHVIPRFSGRPLHSRTLPMLHLWLANAGLAVLVVAWMTRVALPWLAPVALPVGAVLSATGASMFIYNLWRTLDGAAAPRPTPQPVIRPPVAAGRG